MTKELTDDQLCGIARGTKTAEPGRDGYILPVSFARAVIAADRAMQDARHREELAAADLTISNLREAQGVPDGFVHEFKINRAKAIEDAAIEYADAYTELQCDADNDHQREHREALKNLRETIKRGLEVAAAPQPTPEESSAVAQPERKPMTRNQVDDLAEDSVFLRSVYEIVQAVEAFHGIKDAL